MDAKLITLLLTCLCVAVNATPVPRSVHVGTTDGDDPVEQPSPHDTLGALTAQNDDILNRRFIPLKNCKELYDDGFDQSGLYVIQPVDDAGEFVVYCDMDLLDGGWTLIQRRVDESADFDRPWDCYRNGFGDLTKNFWLGLEKIRRLSNYCSSRDGTMELYIGLEDFIGGSVFAKYGKFKLGPEHQHYTLQVSEYDDESTAGDSLLFHDGQAFSAYDSDNDAHATNCAELHKGGWWYKQCHHSNLNGVYYADGVVSNPSAYDGIIWKEWLGYSEVVKTVVIAIRPAH